MRARLVGVLMIYVTVSSCVVPEPQVMRLPPTTMDLAVDTTARQQHPMRTPQDPAVPVDPKEGGVGAHFDVGPQSRLTAPTRGDPVQVGRLSDDPARQTEGWDAGPVDGKAVIAMAAPSRRDLLQFGRLPDGADRFKALDPASVADAPASAAPADGDGDGSYRLNFEDADIRDVLQVVLGQVLKLNYTIAPNASGRITIASTNPQDKAELLSTLETALATQGLSMVRSGSTYVIATMGIGGGDVDTETPRHGFGISVVPLHFTSGAAMSKMLGGLVADNDSVRVDTALNAMVVRGPAPRRAEVVLAIKSFDQDWLHRQATSVFEVRRAKPEEVAAELSHIFDTEENGAHAGLIDIKPIPRLRAVMVTSQNPELVRRAAFWVRKLDNADERVSHNVYVYRPRFRDARELVKLVRGLFNGGSETSTGDADPLAQSGLGATKPGGAETAAAVGLSTSQGGAAGNGTSGSAPIGATPVAATQSSFGSSSLAGSSSGVNRVGSAGNGPNGSVADPLDNATAGPGGSKLSLTADAANNTIVSYTDGTTYAQVLSMLKQLDVAPLQVAVNVIIAEVQLNDELKYGVQFFLTHNNKTAGLTNASAATTAANAATSLASALQGFNFLLGKSISPDIVISALDSVSHVQILSSPSIVVMENKPATLQVGDQVPVTTRTAQSNLTADAPTVNSVDYKDTGIILKIQPRVGQDGSVAMEIDQEISAVAANSNSLTPTISKRRIASDISVLSGQTVLLAGLINDRQQRQKGAVPFLSEAPVVGPLFDSKDNESARTELVVFIRPVVIRNSKGAERVTDEFKNRLKAIRARQPLVTK